MAQLNGVKTVSYGVIIYNGVRYERTEEGVQPGDIARSDKHYDFLPLGAFYSIIKDNEGTAAIVDEDGDYATDLRMRREYTIFREVESAQNLPAVLTPTTAQLIEQKRAELAVLEAKLAEEAAAKRPNVGDYAITLEAGDDIEKGSIVTIRQAEPLDYDGELPFEVSDVRTGSVEWVGQCERLTPEEARAALYARIDELFE